MILEVVIGIEIKLQNNTNCKKINQNITKLATY